MFAGIELLNVLMQPDRIEQDDKEKDEYWR